MTDDEILQAKTNEIRRLHSVCQAKDRTITKAVSMLEQLLQTDSAPATAITVKSVINDLKNAIG